MSCFFDCLWWWRQEFRGQRDPFAAQTSTAAHDDDLITNAVPQNEGMTYLGYPDTFTLDENYFGMFGGFQEDFNYT